MTLELGTTRDSYKMKQYRAQKVMLKAVRKKSGSGARGRYGLGSHEGGRGRGRAPRDEVRIEDREGCLDRTDVLTLKILNSSCRDTYTAMPLSNLFMQRRYEHHSL